MSTHEKYEKHEKYFNICALEAQKSCMTFKHGALLIRDRKIIAKVAQSAML